MGLFKLSVVPDNVTLPPDVVMLLPPLKLMPASVAERLIFPLFDVMERFAVMLFRAVRLILPFDVLNKPFIVIAFCVLTVSDPLLAVEIFVNVALPVPCVTSPAMMAIEPPPVVKLEPVLNVIFPPPLVDASPACKVNVLLLEIRLERLMATFEEIVILFFACTIILLSPNRNNLLFEIVFPPELGVLKLILLSLNELSNDPELLDALIMVMLVGSNNSVPLSP